MHQTISTAAIVCLMTTAYAGSPVWAHCGLSHDAQPVLQLAQADTAPVPEPPATMAAPVVEPAAPAVALDPESTAVEVNGARLTVAEVDEEVQRLIGPADGTVPPDQIKQYLPQMRRQVCEQFVIETLWKSEIEKENIEIQKDAVDEIIEKTRASLPAGITFDQFLERQHLTEEGIREEIGMQLCIQELVNRRTESVTDDDVVAFYEQQKDQMNVGDAVRARHILIQFAPDDDDAARAEKLAAAREIREKLVAGEDFAEMAAARSDCPSSEVGGDLGMFTRGRMVPEFEAAAFSQEIGAIGDVVETQFGYHIIEVTEKTEPHQQTLDEVRPDILAHLERSRRAQAARQYVNELREVANITFADAVSASP